MKIKQSKNRKEHASRYCGVHQIHFIDECPYCSGYQKELDKWGIFANV